MLNWANRFNICSFLDNHAYHTLPVNIECLVAAGVVAQTNSSDLNELRSFLHTHKGKWVFGHLAYNCKDQIEALSSRHTDPIGFPDLFFFLPAIVVRLQEDKLTITTYNGQDPEQVFQEIQAMPLHIPLQPHAPIPVCERLSHQQYTDTIKRLKEHIKRGDCYEINFCQEFFSTDANVDPLSLYHQLTEVSPTPFACYYRLDNKHLLCASPERFLQKKGGQLLSQPIKGTLPRITHDPQLDQQQIAALRNSEKDKSENVMIVDLVRNDLSRVCKEASVRVTELFGIYSFPQVHQMISTITGELDERYDFVDIIKATFPMGSMTGAPKKRVMELIEQYEQSKRGLYAGTVGYMDPEGNFDLNVVIRSLFYNATTQYLSYQVGGAITYYSDPEQEYEECLVKAKAIRRVLERRDN